MQALFIFSFFRKHSRVAGWTRAPCGREAQGISSNCVTQGEVLKSSQDEVDNLFFSPRSSFAPPHPRGPVRKCWMAGVLQRGEVPSHIHHKSTCRDYFGLGNEHFRFALNLFWLRSPGCRVFAIVSAATLLLAALVVLQALFTHGHLLEGLNN